MQNVLIAKCEFCGKVNCIAHSKYYDRCEDCGKRYAKYANYKSMQKTRYTNKRQNLLDDIVEEYRKLQRDGFRVPRDIHQ